MAYNEPCDHWWSDDEEGGPGVYTMVVCEVCKKKHGFVKHALKRCGKLGCRTMFVMDCKTGMVRCVRRHDVCRGCKKKFGIGVSCPDYIYTDMCDLCKNLSLEKK